MANGAVAYDNAFAGIVPTATGSDAGYPLTNGYDGYPASTHKYTGASLSVVFDAGGGKKLSIKGVSLHGHNLVAGEKIRVQMSDDNFATTPVNVLTTLTSGNDFYYLWSSTQSYRYLKKIITPATPRQMSIGEYCGWQNNYVFVRNYNNPWQVIPQLFGRGNSNWGQSNKNMVSKNKKYILDFENLAAAQVAILETILGKSTLCFIPDSGLMDCIFGVTENLSMQESINYALGAMQLSFVANASLI